MQNNIFDAIPADLRNLLFEELLGNPFMGINITDGESRVLFLNRSHRRITGHRPEQYIGRTMAEIAEEGLVSQSATMIAIKKRQITHLSQISSCDNRYFQVIAVPIFDKTDSIKYVINYLIDVSDIVELRSKLEVVSSYNKELQSNNQLLQKKLDFTSGLVYQSEIMQNVVDSAIKVAEHEVSALISGPSGSGKEVIANLVQSRSSRKDKPFIKINCAAIPEQLLESELFGYEPGAFTGGNPKGKKGLIESAHTGTLLLDEIGELPLNLQSKLLRVLQNHKVRHLGGTRDIEVDFRLIASTNADLRKMIHEKTFREDLYYRINVIEIKVPGLEKRKEDIVLLINHFAYVLNEKYNTNRIFSKEAMAFLNSCKYPGNVRELRNVVERAIIMSSNNEISSYDAQLAIGAINPMEGSSTTQETPDLSETGKSLKEMTAEYEKWILERYLVKYKNGARVAEALKMDQSTISRKLTKYGLLSE